MTTTKGLPRDDNNQIAQLTVNTTALAQTRDTDISSSTEITLQTTTQMIEVTAIDGNVYLKYGTDDVTNANFDEFIHKGHVRHYFLPAGTTAVNLIDDGDGATVIVIEK